MLSYVREHSRYYRGRSSREDWPDQLTSLGEFASIPPTTEDDLALNADDMVCLPASSVSRIVRVPTSGSSGKLKTVYFSEADLELMVDYVAHGLRLMFPEPRHAVMLLLMPCGKPGSVGELVSEGIGRIGVRSVAYGPPPRDGSHDDDIIELIEREHVTSVLATATAARRLAEKSGFRERGARSAHGAMAAHRPQEKSGGGRAGSASGIDSVLLSAEYVSDESVSAIETNWRCTVYEHYGMTEMGLGCAMMCANRDGYHIREADLYVEIIDPDSGRPLPDGETGEVVFTTLTREAHPLIRYRTGDTSRILYGPCGCGSPLKRLSRVGDRQILKPY
jgi:phenylacetate-coenzyme A ligase PaaK-like adenylate-forming protein